jgi:ubiquinone/menaquinone biosynthesis C-methylase UbiE
VSREIIEEYWEDPNTVSLIDKNLRILETNAVLKHLSKSDVVLDIGCGSAESTVEFALKVKSCIGVEQSKTMLQKGKTLIDSKNVGNLILQRGNALELDGELRGFDAVISQRVVINFMTWEEQMTVLENAFKALKVGGKLILVENTFEGFENLNSLRRQVGLSDVKLHDWHNYFLVYERFMEFMSQYGTLIHEENFNAYYLLTRVYGNLMANFEGFGINARKDPIFEKIDFAARIIQEEFNSELKFNLSKGSSFGPIQVFVFQKTP